MKGKEHGCGICGFYDTVMARWTFYDYVEPTGRVPFRDWLSGLSDGAQAFIDTRILAMAGLHRWSEKWVSKYRGTDKIFELRCPYMNVQYRPLGSYAPNWSFVLLGGGIEKDDQIPQGTIDSVVRRQRTLEEHPTYVRVHRFD
jgi:hypothetical protein